MPHPNASKEWSAQWYIDLERSAARALREGASGASARCLGAQKNEVMDQIKRLLSIALCVSIWSPTFGQAADSPARTYAGLSLIGDKISVVGHEAVTGSKMDRNRQGSIAMDNRALDTTAVLAAVNAIKRLDPGAATVPMTTNDSTLYELQNQLFESQDKSVAALAALKESIQSQNATHLVLISKHRGDALLRFANEYEGSGKIEGVGFYLDGSIRTRRSDTNAIGHGFLAPFAYIKVALIDARAMTVISEQNVEESIAQSTARAEGSLNPADVLTAAQKAAALQTMIRRAIARVMPELLAAK